MKLIIDIDDELAEKGHWYTDEEMWTVIKAAQNGTPIHNVTNGDIVMAFFPNEHDFEIDFDAAWWNAPYQKGGKE